jgi:DnaJ-class molecular chaperone
MLNTRETWVFNRYCMPCLGLGHYGNDPTDVCTTCSGAGQIELPGVREDYQSCSLCCGTGYGGVSVRSTCRICQGTGLCTITSLLHARIANGDVFIWIAAYGAMSECPAGSTH